MKTKLTDFLTALACMACIMFLLIGAGCATKGGWPCWKWQANTDQKNEVWAKRQMATTNQPTYKVELMPLIQTK